MGNRFGVGLRFKNIAFGGKRMANIFVVFDDAVVNEGDPVNAVFCRKMRMRVVGGRHTVGGPAGVGDAGMAR